MARVVPVTLDDAYARVHAAGLVGIPYRKGGSNFDGCDCWGLVVLASRVLLGRELPNDPLAAKDMVYEIGRNLRDIGDIAVWQIGSDVHTGLLVHRELILHTFENRGSCLLPLISVSLAFARARFYRWRTDS